MNMNSNDERIDKLVGVLTRQWDDPQEQNLLAKMVHELDAKYGLSGKLKREPGVSEIIAQMAGRLASAVGKLSALQGMKVLDIACGSNTSKLPASAYINTSFGEIRLGRSSKEYTALFEPWFCRMLLELGADAAGVDVGDLEGEHFKHYRVDLGKVGALDFLPEHSFDAIQDSRLFGSPEFTAQFPNQRERLQVAREIRRQEQRLLKVSGIIIHSDAQELE